MKKTRKVIFILVIIIVIGILVSKLIRNNSVDKNELMIREKLNKVKADAILKRFCMGGECSEYCEYYICYESNKLYEYTKTTEHPLTDTFEKNHTTYVLKEYSISKENLESLKQIIEGIIEKNKSSELNGIEYFNLEVNGETYEVGNSYYNTLAELLKEITIE